ncbi:MAG: hypothetical protein R2830_21720 [Saprospiraceae bacterium]|nr:hypothetical protein [Saprospiraceae bacterium]
MDSNKTTKLSGLIAKLTNAANRAAAKNEEKSQLQKRSQRNDYHVPMQMKSFDQNMMVPKLFEG